MSQKESVRERDSPTSGRDDIRVYKEIPMTKDTIIEEAVKSYRKEFCNDHNGEVRFLRGVFYDEKDGAEHIESFLRSKLEEIYDTSFKEGYIEGGKSESLRNKFLNI